MKTSTKIFFVYGAVLVGLQFIFLVNTIIRYERLKPAGIGMCESLAATEIHHIQVDISQARYESDKRRWGPREYGPWIVKGGNRSFYFGANLETSRVSNDTLYIKALHDDVSWRPNQIPELRSSTIITADGPVYKEY